MTSVRSSKCYPLRELKTSSISSRGFHSPKRTSYMSTAKCNIIRQENKWKSCMLFYWFCRVLEGAFCGKSSIWMGGNGRLKPGKLLSLIEQIGNNTKTVFHIIDLIFKEQNFFKRRAFLLSHQVRKDNKHFNDYVFSIHIGCFHCNFNFSCLTFDTSLSRLYDY